MAMCMRQAAAMRKKVGKARTLSRREVPQCRMTTQRSGVTELPRRKDKNMNYVGLTDDPEERKTPHGNPSDWWQHSLTTERMLVLKPEKGVNGGDSPKITIFEIRFLKKVLDTLP